MVVKMIVDDSKTVIVVGLLCKKRKKEIASLIKVVSVAESLWILKLVFEGYIEMLLRTCTFPFMFMECVVNIVDR